MEVVSIEKAAERIWHHELQVMLAWYEQHLCLPDFRDPRGHRVLFSIERFPHLIKLLNKNSGKEVNEPRKQVRAIKTGAKTNADFGGYDEERFQTLTWMEAIICRPTRILELIAQPLVGQKKTGDTLYIKQFANTKREYRFNVLACLRLNPALLVPITRHPQAHDHFSGKIYKQVWP